MVTRERARTKNCGMLDDAANTKHENKILEGERRRECDSVTRHPPTPQKCGLVDSSSVEKQSLAQTLARVPMKIIEAAH